MIHRKNLGFWPESIMVHSRSKLRRDKGGKKNSSHREMKRSLIILEITKGRHRMSMPEDAKILSELHQNSTIKGKVKGC